MDCNSLETEACNGWKLRVEFHWHVDRYRHVISAVDPAGVTMLLLESVEGTRDDYWPPSPPLQSLHIDTPPEGRCVALLVGMAGRCHWSASIGPDADGAWLMFDMACRTGNASGQLGSRYQFLTDVQPLGAAGAISLPLGDCALLLAGSQEQKMQAIVHAEENGVRVTPPHQEGHQPTRRWLYHLTLSDL